MTNMNDDIYNMVKKAQEGEQDAFIEIFNKFDPAINKFSNQLSYPEAKSDLYIFIIELIRDLNLNKFNKINQGKLFNYIYNSIKNKKISLHRKNTRNSIDELPINLEVLPSTKNHGVNNVLIDEAFEILTNHQKKILYKKYILGYSDTEIGEKLDISRQAVNQCQNRAIQKIRENIS
jgi:RNA polymerase sigma factor (sigma-70 family)